MKKILVLVLLLFVLTSCSGEVKKTPKGWALDYVITEYGDTPIAYQIEDYIIYDREDLCEDYSCRIFGITLVSSDGSEFKYTVFIAYTERGIPPFIEYNAILESQIYDIDCEEVN